MDIDSNTSVLGQPWLLSVVSGVIAVLVYRFAVVNPQKAMADQPPVPPEHYTKLYTGVFLLTAALVYGSFMVSFNFNVSKLMHNDIPIQTGGAAPF